MAAVIALLTLMVTAAPASAHAALGGSSPGPGTVLSDPPLVVTLTFSEPVELAQGAVRVFDDAFAQVDRGRATSPPGRGDRLQVRLPPSLRRGTYVVVWQVSSADTHPQAGSFRFSVGSPTRVRGQVPGVGRNDPAGLLLGMLRWVGYAGLILGPGLLLAGLLLWPAALAERRTRRMLWTGLGLLVGSTVVAPALQGVWAGNRSFHTLWINHGSLDSHSRRFDQVYALRTYLVLAFAGVLAAALRSSMTAGRRRPVVLIVAGVGLGVTATWPFVGHAAAGSWVPVALILNLLHTAAMALWLGALVLALVAVVPRSVLPQLSSLSFSAVVVLVLTGTAMSWREVGSIEAMTTTTYGRLLMVKLLVVVAVLVLGNMARIAVRRSRPVQALRAGVAAEIGLAVVILALTSALVVLMPASQVVGR